MTYTEIQEVLILSDVKRKNHTYLQNEFPYKSSYELMNIAIMDAAKKGEESVSFDFIDNDMTGIGNKTLNEIEVEFRRIYPSNNSWVYAKKNTFNYPRYLASRSFEIEIRDSLKNHSYESKSYFITWEME